MIFGARIKQLRLENKYTQEYVCNKLNISLGALSRYETGMYEPKSLELIVDFANLFGVTTDYLLGKSDARTSNAPQDAIYEDAKDLTSSEITAVLKFYKELKNNINNSKKTLQD